MTLYEEYDLQLAYNDGLLEGHERIEQLEQLCRDMYWSHVFPSDIPGLAPSHNYYDRMQELGLLEE